MKLTGKCKEAFEKWLCDNNTPLWRVRNEEWITDSMMYSVYVDFFDSVGIQVSNRPYFDTFEWRVDMIDHEKKKVNSNSDAVPTRPEARTKAIEKANEICNA